MHLVSHLCRQKFWRLVNNYVIHTTLHRAKKVMVKVWYVDSLVNDQVERPPCLRVSVSYHTTYGLVLYVWRKFTIRSLNVENFASPLLRLLLGRSKK